MPRGAPDYYLYQQKQTVLGTYDRRGDVVDFDDFEAPIVKWNITPIVVGDTATLDSTNCQSGGQAIKLHCENNAASSIQIRRGTGLLGTKRIGMEISFSMVGVGLDLFFWLFCAYGGQLPYGLIHIDAQNGIAEYYSSGLVFVPFANVAVLRNEYFLFHTLKFVVDFPNDRYVRCMLDDTSYDLSLGTPLPRVGFIPNLIAYAIVASTKDAVGGEAWLDDFILTLNEP